MAITNAGINFLAQAAVGQGTAFNSSNARIGVGNGTAAFAASQTDLQGASKFRKAMDSGYPTIAAPVVTFKSTFAPSEANFPWNEWGIFNAASGGVMLNRVVESNGTKQSNQTWILEVAITFAIGT
jgi:hypothetical protein